MNISSDDWERCRQILQRVSEDTALINSDERMKALIAKIHKEGQKGERRASGEQRRSEDQERLAQTGKVRQERGPVSQAALPEGLTTSGTLNRPRRCYVCKQPYAKIHSFYHLLCPACAEFNFQKRHQRADLSGRVALITGGRIKIGCQMALRLLRDGAKVLVTTRFPADCARRFESEADAGDWQDRLLIYGLDLRDLPAVDAFARHLLDSEPALDILINNAAQTIKRPPAFYRHLIVGEQNENKALPGGAAVSPTLPETQLADYFPPNFLDADGQQMDFRPANSWSLTLADVSPREMLEVQLVNVVAPFLLASRLKPLLRRSSFAPRFIVNVSAMEGQFSRAGKTVFHPHTNMAKAALNMMTRTSASDYARDDIWMNSVDTGWITDENPHPKKTRLQERGFYTPLDVIDGMACVYDPIVQGVNSPDQPLYGLFLKDYAPCPW